MSDITTKDNNSKTVYNNTNERHYTFEDDELANTIFFDGNVKKDERIYGKEEINPIIVLMKTHFIFLYQELNHIQRII